MNPERGYGRVLVTGATGFVGHTLCGSLAQAGFSVRAVLHGDRAVPSGVSERIMVGSIDEHTGWTEALEGVDSVVHLAARAHVLNDAASHSDLYTRTNALGTLRLAQASAAAGIRRFVYLSSVKVNGERTGSRPFTAHDAPDPRDAYGRSKYDAERYALAVSAASSMEVVVVRPPLVYGPAVRANFLRLMSWVYKGRPLPLGAVDNRRSLVSVWTLCDLLCNVLTNGAAANRIWMVSDGEDLSTPELIRRLGLAMRRKIRLVRVPPNLLKLAGGVVGRTGEVSRLCDSLVVDIELTRRGLGWVPPMSVDEALSRTVGWYMAQAVE